MTEKYAEPSDLDGFDELKPEDQAKITTAYQTGSVADEDIPDSARKPEGEEKPKKAAAKKKKADDGEESAEKPKKARATTSKVFIFCIPWPVNVCLLTRYHCIEEGY